MQYGSALLASEFETALDNLDNLWIERFRALGLPDRVLRISPPLVGVGCVETSSEGFFEFWDHGVSAVIVPVGVPQCLHWNPLDDLIAFTLDKPDRWWLRRRAVDLLGAYNVTPWRLSPLTVYETPFNLLRAGGGGIVILDWNRSPADVLRRAGPLEAESDELKARLQQRVQEVALEQFSIEVIGKARNAA